MAYGMTGCRAAAKYQASAGTSYSATAEPARLHLPRLDRRRDDSIEKRIRRRRQPGDEAIVIERGVALAETRATANRWRIRGFAHESNTISFRRRTRLGESAASRPTRFGSSAGET